MRYMNNDMEKKIKYYEKQLGNFLKRKKYKGLIWSEVESKKEYKTFLMLHKKLIDLKRKSKKL